MRKITARGDHLIPIDPDELVGPLVTGWPLDGAAANWVFDLQRGEFGDLRLRIGRSELESLFNFSDARGPMRPRGPAAVRLRIGWEEDEEPPDDDDADMEYVVDVELEWSELVESGHLEAPTIAPPLVLLPSGRTAPCVDLTLSDMEKEFGPPTDVHTIFMREDDELWEWQRYDFFVSASTWRGILTAVGFSALSLDGAPPLRLVHS